jgi:hypothetical protein
MAFVLKHEPLNPENREEAVAEVGPQPSDDELS